MKTALTSRVSNPVLRQSYIEISRFVRSHKIKQSATSTCAGQRWNRCLGAGSTQRPYSVSCRRSAHDESPSKHGHDLNRDLSSLNPATRKRWEDVLRSFTQSSAAVSETQNRWDDVLLLNNSLVNEEGGLPEQDITLYGFITTQRLTKKATFIQLAHPALQQTIQLVVDTTVQPEVGFKKTEVEHLRPHTPVTVTGKLVSRPRKQGQDNPIKHTFDPAIGEVDALQNVELRVSSIQSLNDWPEDLTAEAEAPFPPEQRNLTIRTNQSLRGSLFLRSALKQACCEHLAKRGFTEVETPLLFKSTPEGAREFVVPTRTKGFAYALPQSPQQYKQALMASGISRYFQFARCFRDEDLRADRQPEFTQLDLEMSFADSGDVMATVERIVLDVVWPLAGRADRLPNKIRERLNNSTRSTPRDLILDTMTYQEAMSTYGIDKPDPRWGAPIHNITGSLPTTTISMMSSLHDPLVEIFKLHLPNSSPTETRDFINDFMKLGSSAQFSTNPDGMPAIGLYDSRAPLSGLSAFGHEGAAYLEDLLAPTDGDVLVAQTRPNQPLTGGSTTLGRLRQRMHEHALKRNLIPSPPHDSLLWIIDFPLFTPTDPDPSSPGQGGTANLASTHHPFTAPAPHQNLSLLLTNPMHLLGAHYDLVVNGTELGGGSVRIHQTALQELIFTDILKMPPERVEDFRYLLDALRAGCPPHAGFALGFDRLVAVLRGRESVRDVIAFPKASAEAGDAFVGSPGRLTAEQLATYHLRVDESNQPPAREAKVSFKA